MADEQNFNNIDGQHELLDHSNLVPTPMASSSRELPAVSDQVSPMSTQTVSLDRGAMRDLASEENSEGLSLTDLSAGSTEVKQDVAESEEREVLKIYCHKCHQKLDVTYMEPFSHFDCPSCNEDLIVPQWFDNFLLEERVGIGGMAMVYRALDLTLDREVAIKVLNSELDAGDSRDMFLNEARMAANISSHAVVPIYTCGMFKNSAYIAMQFMPGKSLENVIHEQGASIPITDAVKWLKDVSDGLNTAMLTGVVHHDIKPGNLMLDFENRAKICDFGLSQAVGDTKQAASRGWVSPHYVSPEKLVSGVEDYRGDIYSLGATFYHVLSGQTAFNGNNIEDIMRDRLERDPVPVANLRADIPAEINELIMAMLNRDPDMRPAYSQIIEHITMFMMSTMKKKRSSLKTKKNMNVNAKRTSANNIDKILAQSRKSNPLVTFVKVILFTVFAAGAAFYTWDSKFFAEPMKPIETVKTFLNMKKSMPKDWLPDVTEAFAVGDAKKAEILANIFLESGSRELDKVKQGMLQLVVAQYLRGSVKAPKTGAEFVEKLAGLGSEQDITDSAISYMSEGGISEDELKKQLDGDEFARSLASTLIFIKNVYVDSGAEEIGKKFTEFEGDSSKSSAMFWGNVWQARLSSWQQELLQGDAQGVEKVFSGKKMALDAKAEEKSLAQTLPSSVDDVMDEVNAAPVVKVAKLDASKTKLDTSKVGVVDAVGFGDTEVEGAPEVQGVKSAGGESSIAGVTPSKLKAARSKFSDRPQPSDFVFKADVVKLYLSKVKDETDKDLEGKRVRLIDGLRSYAVHANNRTTLEMKSLKLKKKRLSVSRVTLTPNYISVKVGSKYQKLDWDLLSYEQFLDILVFYVKRKESVTVSEGIISKSDLKKAIAMDYYRIAIFCDWYGDYSNAVKYGEKTLSVDPRFEKAVNMLLGL